MARRKTQEEFVAEVKKVAPQLEVIGDYVNTVTKILVRGDCGHEWLVIPRAIVTGVSGVICRQCIPFTKTLEKFSKEVELVSSNISIVGEYVNSKTDIEIRYSDCGHTALVNPDGLRRGARGVICRICKPTYISGKPHHVFEKELLAINPGLRLLDTYVGAYTRLNVTAACRHIWSISPHDFLVARKGSVCRVCNPQKTTVKMPEQFIHDVAIAAPDIEVLDEYTAVQVKLRVRHKVCGFEWEIIPNNFLRRASDRVCRRCTPVQVSRAETDLADWLEKYTEVVRSDRTILNPKELDIVLPQLKLAIEFNGCYWHSAEYKDKMYHIDKTIAANAAGYEVIHLWDYEWETKKDKIKGRLSTLLGRNLVISARKCKIVRDFNAKEFLDVNHVQGHAPSSVNIGLEYNDELVMVMTFGKPRFNTNYDYELIRLCTLEGITVQGGASKLFKYRPKGSIISYHDLRFGNAKIYERLGFSLLRKSLPGYFYHNNGNTLSRYQCQKHKLRSLFPSTFSPELTEEEILGLNNYYRVYDCGQAVYELAVKE